MLSAKRLPLSCVQSKRGFSLIEVVLAIGVLSLAILSLLGLFAPTMTSVRNVIDKNEATGIMSKLNAEIQNDGVDLSALTGGRSMFDALTSWASGGHILYFWTTQPISAAGSLGNTTIKISDNLSVLNTDLTNGDLSGSGLFIVVLSKAELIRAGAAYDYGANANEAYVPVKVGIYGVAVDRALQEDFSITINGDGLSGTNNGITEGDLLISYTTARVR